MLVIDKPLGLTSMGVCRAVRTRLIRGGARKKIKVGHGGTLDPLASGVLVVLVGKATKLCDVVMAGAKRYEAVVDLSNTSDTDDHEGELTPVEVASPPDLARVKEVLAEKFVGDIMQSPPAHSAMKVGGKRAYELARAGRLDKLAARPVRIDSIDVLEYSYPRLVLDVACGKGTYIRSLARDLGTELGTGGMLDGLRRTRVGRFLIDASTPLDDLPETLSQDDLLVTPEVQALIDKAIANQ